MSTVRTGPCPTKGTLRSRISFRPPPIKVLEMALGRHASPLGGKPAYRTLAPNGEPGDRSRELAGRAPRGRRFSNFGKGYRPEIPAAAARPRRVKDGYVRAGTEIEDSIGPWQEDGQIWFGKTFYDGEGSTGVGGFGYFDMNERRLHMFAPPEIADRSVSAINVGPDAAWMALG